MKCGWVLVFHLSFVDCLHVATHSCSPILCVRTDGTSSSKDEGGTICVAWVWSGSASKSSIEKLIVVTMHPRNNSLSPFITPLLPCFYFYILLEVGEWGGFFVYVPFQHVEFILIHWFIHTFSHSHPPLFVLWKIIMPPLVIISLVKGLAARA